MGVGEAKKSQFRVSALGQQDTIASGLGDFSISQLQTLSSVRLLGPANLGGLELIWLRRLIDDRPSAILRHR